MNTGVVYFFLIYCNIETTCICFSTTHGNALLPMQKGDSSGEFMKMCET
jgi:hypothetical protein